VVNARPALARLAIESLAPNAARVSAMLMPGQRADDVVLAIAITQDGLVTHVKAGENSGATLRHDHVVRDMRIERKWSAGATPAVETRVEFAPRADWKLGNMRIVAFVQNLRTGEVLQALAAPRCER
jgi:hypothetical protein